MKIIDIDRWEEILVTITRNKTRSVLTAFGVFWGIFMLVVMIGGGNGMEKAMKSNFSGFATNSGFVIANPTSEAYKGFRKGRYWSMKNQDVDILRSKMIGIEHITPCLFSWPSGNNTVRGEVSGSFQVRGSYPSYNYIEQQKMKFGRYVNDVDLREARKVCTIGTRVYEVLFKKGEDPCGKFIRVDGIYYRVIGVCSGNSNIQIGGSSEEMITLPFTTMQKTKNRGEEVDLICFTSRKGYTVTAMQKEIERLVKDNHKIAPDDPKAIFFINSEKMGQIFDNLFTGITLLIWIVGLGTLSAGIIGVSNIMMVTVKERTGEIGIRRAIGAKPIEIMQQILSESMVLTGIAGMTGICFGVFVLQVLNVGVSSSSGTDAGFQISFWTAIGTTLILLTLGSLAGLAPAWRAMSIKPIEAIRDE